MTEICSPIRQTIVIYQKKHKEEFLFTQVLNYFFFSCYLDVVSIYWARFDRMKCWFVRWFTHFFHNLYKSESVLQTDSHKLLYTN